MFFWDGNNFIICRSAEQTGSVRYNLRTFEGEGFKVERPSCGQIDALEERIITPTPGFHFQLFWRPENAPHGTQLLSIQSDIYIGQIFIMESAKQS
jgi:hypothetical protein